MNVIKTEVTENHVHLRLADQTDPAQATSWIDCRLPRSALIRGSGTPVDNIDELELPIIRQVILENAQLAIAAEIAQMKSLVSPNRVPPT
jgi:hypothetical protein